MEIDMAPGERLLWEGQPMQRMRLTPQDAFAIPFATVWLLLVVGIFVATVSGEATNVDPLTYVLLPVFILVGLYMLIGRLMVDRATRRRTHYYLTNRRALIKTGLFRASRRSVSLMAIPEIRFRAGRKGRGTVQFGSQGMFGMIPPSWPGASQFLPPAFDDIESADLVYNLALSAQRDAQASR